MQDLLELLRAAGWLAAAILLGSALLRAATRTGLFRRAAGFLPASLLGGVVLLAAGPAGADILPISPAEWALVQALPAVLIVPIIAAAGFSANARAMGRCALSFTAILLGVSALQLAIGALFAAALGSQIYPTFGLELAAGFAGGHSTAGLIARALADLGAPWWVDAQSVAVGTATVGLGGGIVLGLGFIAWAQKRGWLASGGGEPAGGAGAGRGALGESEKPGEKPAEQNLFKTNSLARNPRTYINRFARAREAAATRSPVAAADREALEPAALARTLGVLLIASALALAAQSAMAPYFRGFGAWSYALLITLAICLAAPRLAAAAAPAPERRALVAILSDFAIAAAVASMNLRLISEHFVAFFALCAVGFVATALFLIAAFAICLPSRWFLRFIAAWGSSTGVFLTGILLLRAADPAGKSGVLSEYSIAFSLSGLVFYSILQPVFALAISGAALQAAGYLCALVAASALVSILLRQKR